MNTIPRRARLDLCTPAELAIVAAVDAVEKVGADPRLTEAVILLGKARDEVADYLDRLPHDDNCALQIPPSGDRGPCDCGTF